MKVLLLLILTMTSLNVGAKGYADMFNVVHRNKLYHSSYIFLKRAIKRNEKVSTKKVNQVLDAIHPSVFIHDVELDAFTKKRTKIDYSVGLRKFFLNDFATAKKKLKTISKKHPMYVESNYLLGLIALTQRKSKLALKHFRSCIKYSAKKKVTKFKSKKYIRTFRNRCVQQVGRISFANKKYKKAIKTYSFVKKDDYIWPRFLLDKAWTYYWLGENERALGTVITYKAPLLRRFMVPEANYLRGLIYYEMCYFEKAEKIQKEFNVNIWKYRKVLKKASRNKLLKIIQMDSPPKGKANQFLYYYLKGFKKDIRYFSYIDSNKILEEEMRKLSRIKSLRQARIFLDTLSFYKKAIREDFVDFLKALANDYYTQIGQMRNAFVKLNLMVSLKKRKQLAKGKSATFKDTIKTVSLDDISGTEDKFIWDFQGGFWADELGDYAVALKNRCRR